MWQSGRKILLKELLESLTLPKGIAWTLLDFCGSGGSPAGGRMEDFEAEIRSVSFGFPLSVEQLDIFAAGLTDITDVQLIGKLGDEAVVEIRGVDSTFWEVVVDGVSVNARSNSILTSKVGG